MGRVQIDIHKEDRKWQGFELNDKKCIEYLILYRGVYDSYVDSETNNNCNQAGDVSEFVTELICLYADLDNLIKRTKLTPRQKFIIERFMEGYHPPEIAQELDLNAKIVMRGFKTAIKKLKRKNDQIWKYDWLYFNHLVAPWTYKTCSKCGELLPAVDEFFWKDKNRKDGLDVYCSDCRKSGDFRG